MIRSTTIPRDSGGWNPRWLPGMRTLVGGLILSFASAAGAQEPAEDTIVSQAQRVTVEWTAAPMEEVIQAFAELSARSIVAGPEVTGYVTAYIEDRPWDVALDAILDAHGFAAVEDDYGIIRVGSPAMLGVEQEEEPLVTRTYRLSFARASELQGTLAPHLSERGSISVAESTNTLIITDVERVHRAIGGLLP